MSAGTRLHWSKGLLWYKGTLGGRDLLRSKLKELRTGHGQDVDRSLQQKNMRRKLTDWHCQVV